MQSSGGDVAATHSLSPSGFIREGQKSQPCRDDGLRVTAAMSQQEASRLGALGPRRACCCCLGRGRVAAAGEEGAGRGGFNYAAFHSRDPGCPTAASLPLAGAGLF